MTDDQAAHWHRLGEDYLEVVAGQREGVYDLDDVWSAHSRVMAYLDDLAAEAVGGEE